MRDTLARLQSGLNEMMNSANAEWTVVERQKEKGKERGERKPERFRNSDCQFPYFIKDQEYIMLAMLSKQISPMPISK